MAQNALKNAFLSQKSVFSGIFYLLAVGVLSAAGARDEEMAEGAGEATLCGFIDI